MKVTSYYQQQLPGVSVFQPSAGVDYRGLSVQSATQSNLSRSVFALAEAVQTSARRDMVLTEMSRAQQEISKAQIAFDSDPDHRTIASRFDTQLDEIRKAHEQNIQDPMARIMFNRKYQEYATPQRIKMQYYQHSREVDAQQGNLVEVLDSKLDLIGKTALDDEATYHAYQEEALGAINEKAMDGIISRKKAAELRAGFRNGAAGTRARQAILENAEKAYVDLSSGKYAGLDPLARIQLTSAAKAKWEADVRQAVTDAERAERKEDKERADRQNDFAMGLYVEFSKGNLRRDEVVTAAEMRLIGLSHFKFFQNEFDADTATDDPATLFALETSILNDTFDYNAVMEAPGLTPARRVKYLEILRGMKNDRWKEDFQTQMNLIKGYIVTTGPLQNLIPGEQARLARANEDFYSLVMDQKKPMREAAAEVINKWSRVNMRGGDLPNLMYGTPRNLDGAEDQLVSAFEAGDLSRDEFEAQASLLEMYRQRQVMSEASKMDDDIVIKHGVIKRK